MSDDLSSAARLIAVLDHLGLGRVHIATQIPGDIAELAAANPDRLAGIVLCAPFYLDPAPFILLADRVLMVSGEHGPGFDVTVRAAARLPGAERHVLDGYEAQTWSDVAADRTVELTEHMTGFLARFVADAPRSPAIVAAMPRFPITSRAADPLCCCCRYSMRRRNGRRQSRFSLAISPS